MNKHNLMSEQILSKKYKDFVHNHTHCTLCGHALDIKHMKDLDQLIIKEEAYCNECDVRARSKEHILN